MKTTRIKILVYCALLAAVFYFIQGCDENGIPEEETRFLALQERLVPFSNQLSSVPFNTQPILHDLLYMDFSTFHRQYDLPDRDWNSLFDQIESSLDRLESKKHIETRLTHFYQSPKNF